MDEKLRELIRYKFAENNLRVAQEKINKKYSIPEINYKSFWSIEVEIRKVFKEFRGW